MKCPTCGQAELKHESGTKKFRGSLVQLKWRECPKCGEKLYPAKEVKRAVEISNANLNPTTPRIKKISLRREG
jgi:YgiT-type zinc finger domain-containing protein